jgi:hypothetical protein
MNGTGAYSSASLHPSVEDALKVNPVAYPTLDRPEIVRRFKIQRS